MRRHACKAPLIGSYCPVDAQNPCLSAQRRKTPGSCAWCAGETGFQRRRTTSLYGVHAFDLISIRVRSWLISNARAWYLYMVRHGFRSPPLVGQIPSCNHLIDGPPRAVHQVVVRVACGHLDDLDDLNGALAAPRTLAHPHICARSCAEHRCSAHCPSHRTSHAHTHCHHAPRVLS